MIHNFGSNRLKRFFERGDKGRIHADPRDTVRDILARLKGSVAEKGEKTLHAPEPSFPTLAALSTGSGWQESFTTNNSILLANPAYCHLPPLSYRREPAMPMVRPMSGLAAIVQTWPLGDSIGVRQQYPTLCRDTLRYALTTHLFGPVTT